MKVAKRLGLAVAGVLVLLVGLYVVWCVVADDRLQQTLAEQAAAGLPLQLADILPAPVPDNQNAAPLLSRAYILMQTSGLTGALAELDKAGGDSIQAAMSSTNGPAGALRGLLISPRTSYFFDLLRQASERPGYDARLDYSKGPALLMPHLAPTREAIRLITLRAWMFAQAGDFKRALQDLRVGLAISDLLRSEPVLISQLVRVSMDAMILSCLNAVIDMASPGQLPKNGLKALEDALGPQEEPARMPFVRALDGERIVFGQWLFNRATGEGFRADELKGSQFESYAPLLTTRLARPWMQTEHRHYLTVMARYRERASQPYYATAPGPGVLAEVPRYAVLCRLCLPALDRIYESMARSQAIRELARAGLAIERHRMKTGAYPDALSELERSPAQVQDPFTGAAFSYAAGTNNVVLYSKGPGTVAAASPGPDASLAVDLVWRVTP